MAKRKAPAGRKASGAKKTSGRAAGARKRTSRATKSRPKARKAARKRTARGAARKTAPRRAAKKTARRTGPAARARKTTRTAPKPVTTERAARAAAPAPRQAPRRAAPEPMPPPSAAPPTPEPGGAEETQGQGSSATEDTEEDEEPLVPGAPSSLMPDRRAGRARAVAVPEDEFAEEVSADGGLRAGDIDVRVSDAYSVGDEAPGGDNPTPDQDVVDLIGRSLGVEYEDGEELKGADKIAERDRRRWELDPASSEDYRDRAKKR